MKKRGVEKGARERTINENKGKERKKDGGKERGKKGRKMKKVGGRKTDEDEKYRKRTWQGEKKIKEKEKRKKFY